MTVAVTITVSGMKCGGCETNVTEKVKEIEGIISVSALHKDDSVELEFDENKTSLDEITKVITDAGFTVEL